MEKENKSKEEELREELRLLDEAEGDLIRMEEYLNKKWRSRKLVIIIS